PLSDMKLWLKAETGVTRQDTNNSVDYWLDQSGNHADASQATAANQPLWVDGAINGRPAVRFDGANDYFVLPNFLNGTTQAEAFVVLKATVDAPTDAHGLWRVGGAGGDYYPSSDGMIYESFGATTTYVVGNPAQPLDQYHLYNAAGKAGEWTARINGLIQYSTTNNTYGYYTAPVLGAWGSTYFDGAVAEVLIYNRVLSAAERDAVNSYLNSKYALVTNAPAGPTNLTASTVSPTQINLAWSNVTPTAGVQIERKAGPSGAYSTIGTVTLG